MPVLNLPIANDADFKTAIEAAYYYVASKDQPTQVPPTTIPAQPIYKVAFIGDSRLADNVQGTYKWAELMNHPTEIISLAIPGEKAADFLNNEAAKLKAIDDSGAETIVLQYGKNDVDAGCTAKQIANMIASIVGKIKVRPKVKRVIVTGVLPVSVNASGASYTNSIIDQTGTEIYNLMSGAGGIWYQGYAGMKDGPTNALNSSYTDDSSHLNAAGRTKYAESLLNFLKTISVF